MASEAAEATALVSADTSWAAGLRLRYTRDRAEFGEACAKLRELLPEDGPASRALAAWVRGALIDDGAKEAEVKRLQKLGDLERVADTFWGAERLAERRKGRREVARARREQRATLVRLAGRKFGSETAEGLASLLERASDSGACGGDRGPDRRLRERRRLLGAGGEARDAERRFRVQCRQAVAATDCKVVSLWARGAGDHVK